MALLPRGGSREGQPGKAYPNRSDLTQAPKTVPGQTYGKQAEQAAAQRVNPLPQQAPPTPIQVPPLGRPTDRPNEPVMAGAPMGPGPGPEVLGFDPDEEVGIQLRALYEVLPSSDLREAIEEFDADRGFYRA